MVKNKTKVIVYAKEGYQCGDVFNKMITGLAPKEDIEIYTTISSLSSRLRQPKCEFTIVVLLISDGEDLENILATRPLLDNVHIILVLPDSKSATVRTGHSLHPRYLSFKDGPLSDVASVLARMIEVEKINNTNLWRGL